MCTWAPFAVFILVFFFLFWQTIQFDTEAIGIIVNPTATLSWSNPNALYHFPFPSIPFGVFRQSGRYPLADGFMARPASIIHCVCQMEEKHREKHSTQPRIFGRPWAHLLKTQPERTHTLLCCVDSSLLFFIYFFIYLSIHCALAGSIQCCWCSVQAGTRSSDAAAATTTLLW